MGPGRDAMDKIKSGPYAWKATFGLTYIYIIIITYIKYINYRKEFAGC